MVDLTPQEMERFMAILAKGKEMALQRYCSECKAQPGEACVSESGQKYVVSVHHKARYPTEPKHWWDEAAELVA